MSNKNELLLQDRLEKIRSVISKYGEENFYISYSGGKDSTALHHLFDLALPGNKIPRVYVDTGIELLSIQHYVYLLAAKDDRFNIVHPKKNIRHVLEEYGYPFKSKEHSLYYDVIKRNGLGCKTAQRYLHPSEERKQYGCPQILRYQFESDLPFKISDQCCVHLKENPIKEWCELNGKRYGILGITGDEGGRRNRAQCMRFKDGKFINFQPLAIVSKEWEDWFLNRYDIKLCKLYYPPYNFKRTGCKGCPFNSKLQKDLDTLAMYFQAERKQCEIIWKPVYEEYRRIGYRLRKVEDT